MRYRVYGTRSGTDFQAPVYARTASDAIDLFLDSVGDHAAEYDNVRAEVWG